MPSLCFCFQLWFSLCLSSKFSPGKVNLVGPASSRCSSCCNHLEVGGGSWSSSTAAEVLPLLNPQKRHPWMLNQYPASVYHKIPRVLFRPVLIHLLKQINHGLKMKLCGLWLWHNFSKYPPTLGWGAWEGNIFAFKKLSC